MAKNRIAVDEDVCKGCVLCIDVCPKQILEPDKAKINQKGYNPVVCIDMGGCSACAMCAIICPDSAIKVERDVN